MNIIYLLIWIIFIVAVAYVHSYIIEDKNQRPNYLAWFVFKCMVGIAHAVLFAPSNWHEWLPILYFQVVSWFIIYSPALNLMRGKPWWYLGKNSGWLDKYLLNHPAVYFISYWLASPCLVILIIKLS